MLEPIPRSKYPAVTEEEERLAKPLQIVCQAIFDAVLVHFMNLLSPENEWQVVKRKICNKLYRQKQDLTMEILATRYAAVDIMCLQEVAAVFRDTFYDSTLSATHILAVPARLDGKRDQNSMLLLRKEAFMVDTIREVTALVEKHVPTDIKFADGDIIVMEAMHVGSKRPYLMVSFHGDTNGLMTLPAVQSIQSAIKEHFPGHVLIIGLDANTYEDPVDGKMSWQEFLTEVTGRGLTTCWGDAPDVTLCRTTCSARTSLQPQLNKAVRHADIAVKSDRNPKDLILHQPRALAVLSNEEMGRNRQPNPMKDNTGRLAYLEGVAFPSMEFPSDHGIVAVALKHV